jgi:hypothetical protein
MKNKCVVTASSKRRRVWNASYWGSALGHNIRTIDILKIDCEGCKYQAILPLFELIADITERVKQLQIELHTRRYSVGKGFGMSSLSFAAANKDKMRIFRNERKHWE